ncbi:SCO family protein [Stakelama saccharophila]|uniref:SCO family protein n=1 Tax=Stakelama saccharophila TaxID=3075605 RepID=A0ABZ0B9A2_9SPHN|nr:SCO family protein [Stakelama sp. W311]WNO53992.1 SCO family protein [Stakelama sp. W311]
MTHRYPRMIGLAALALLGACDQASDPASARSDEPPLAGASIGGPYRLVNQDGKTVGRDDFAGKYRVVYFGYTYCPDICPVDMGNLGKAMRDLDRSDPALARQVVPVFISVDPARDTPPVLKQYVSAFYPRMVGLTGTDEQIAKVADEFAVYYKRVGDNDENYLVNHSGQAYLMGPSGEPIALVPVDESPEAVEKVLKRWVT